MMWYFKKDPSWFICIRKALGNYDVLANIVKLSLCECVCVCKLASILNSELIMD